MYIDFNVENVRVGTRRIQKALSDVYFFTASLEIVGEQLKEEMASYIETQAKREPSTGNLEGAIRSTNLQVSRDEEGRYVVDVVKTGDLEGVAPYWYVLNYGKKVTGEEFIPPQVIGSFPDHTRPDPSMRGKGTEQWETTGDGSLDFLMAPTTFTPINYIEHTHSLLPDVWKTEWEKKMNDLFRRMETG